MTATETQTTEYRVHFTYINGYGSRKRVTTIVEALDETAAVKAARAEIDYLYCITNARLERVDNVAAEWTGTGQPHQVERTSDGYSHRTCWCSPQKD